MADSSRLPELLDQASNVFSLASKLGRAFNEQGQLRVIYFDPSIWEHHAPTFNEFCEDLLKLRDAIQNPPEGFAIVADQLLKAARIAKCIRDSLAMEGRTFTTYLDFYPDLNTVAQKGWKAVKQVTKTKRMDDPFAFVDETGGNQATAKQSSTLPDPFLAAAAGHVAFLESVRDEVHYAAEAKRQQLARQYSNDTLANMVRAIKWAEAREQTTSLPGWAAGAVEHVDCVLRRELTVGTIEQIDDLLTPTVRALRDAWENRDLAHNQSAGGEQAEQSAERFNQSKQKRSMGSETNSDSSNSEQMGTDDGQPEKDHRIEMEKADGLASKEERRAKWIGKALVLRKANPNMTKAEIARQVGIHPGQLSPQRFPELAELEKMLQGSTTSGHLIKDLESGLSDVEATTSTDDKPYRGNQIAGSKLFREYCVECNEPIRVPEDKVGTHPRCKDCE